MTATQLTCCLRSVCVLFMFMVLICASVDIQDMYELKDTTIEVKCEYNVDLDNDARNNELIMTIQDCGNSINLVSNPQKFTFIAAILGKLSFQSKRIKAIFPANTEPPKLKVNQNNNLVKRKIVDKLTFQATSSGIPLGIIRGEMKVNSELHGRCLLCAQTVTDVFVVSITKKSRINVIVPPKVLMKYQGRAVSDQEVVTAKVGGTAASFECQVTQSMKDDQLTKRFWRTDRSGGNRKELDFNAAFIVSTVQKNSSGKYYCEVRSNQRNLINKRKNVDTKMVELNVLYKPEFQVNEIIRHTKQGDIKEDIEVVIISNPKPSEFTCNPHLKPQESTKSYVSYNPRTHQSKYSVILRTLESRKKRDVICRATNQVGSSQITITLTAYPPNPIIVSNNVSKWYNSYNLKWHHSGQDTNVERYEVEVTMYDKKGTNVVNKTEHKVNLNSEDKNTGPVKLLKPYTENGKRVHNGIVYGLNPERKHKIIVSSCSEVGCKKSQEHVVFTPKEHPNNYNDPEIPVNEALSDDGKSGLSLSTSATLIPVLVTAMFTLATNFVL